MKRREEPDSGERFGQTRNFEKGRLRRHEKRRDPPFPGLLIEVSFKLCDGDAVFASVFRDDPVRYAAELRWRYGSPLAKTDAFCFVAEAKWILHDSGENVTVLDAAEGVRILVETDDLYLAELSSIAHRS